MTPEIILEIVKTLGAILSAYLLYLYRKQAQERKYDRQQLVASKVAVDTVITANNELRLEIDRLSDHRRAMAAEIASLRGALSEQRENHNQEMIRLTSLLSEREATIATLRAEVSALRQQLADFTHGNRT